MSDAFALFDRVLDEESWDWLNDTQPAIANQVKTLVNAGTSPGDIRNRVLTRIGSNRREFAARCENAARYLAALRQN